MFKKKVCSKSIFHKYIYLNIKIGYLRFFYKMAFEKIVEAPIGHILFFKVNIRCHGVPNKEAGNI